MKDQWEDDKRKGSRAKGYNVLTIPCTHAWPGMVAHVFILNTPEKKASGSLLEANLVYAERPWQSGLQRKTLPERTTATSYIFAFK